MSGRRKSEQVDSAMVAKIQKLRNQGLTHALISERLGLSKQRVDVLAKQPTK